MNNRRRVFFACLFLMLLAVGGIMEILLLPGARDVPATLLLEAAIRLLYAGAAALLCLRLARPSRGRPAPLSGLAWLTMALSFAVAINNFPIRTLLSGAARVTAGAWPIVCLALSCLATALFEEILFRGFFLRACLVRLGEGKRARFLAVLLSSAVFGLVHLFNLAAGAPPLPTLLQVGYAFLVGCVAATLFLVSGRLSVSVAFHAVYNFGGYLVPRLGVGPLYDTPTVVVTVLLSVACGIAVLAVLWREKENFLKKNKISLYK